MTVVSVAVQLSQYPSQRCKKPLGYVCSLTSEEEKRRGNGKSRNEVRCYYMYLRPITIQPEAIPRAFAVIRASLQHPNVVLEHIYKALASGQPR